MGAKFDVLLGQLRTTDVSSGGGSGTVTSIDVSGGTTGLTFTGGPITTNGTITAGGTLGIAFGGTGSATQNFVDLTTTQTNIAGAKTFTSTLTNTDNVGIQIMTNGNNGFLFNNSGLVGAPNNWNIKTGSDGTFLFDQGGGLNARFKLGGTTSSNYIDFTPDYSNSYFKVTGAKAVTTSNNTLDNGSGASTIASTLGVTGIITSSGGITMADAKNIIVGTTTGTQIATTTTQKLGFYGVTAVVQQTAITDLGTVLSNLGLRASGTAYPITTSGTITFTGITNLNNGLVIPLLKKISITTGTNASAGTGTLASGTATISTSVVTASSLIFITDTSGSTGQLSVGTKTAGTSFVVNSSLITDTSTFNWLIIN